MPQTENSKIFGGWLKASRACMGYGGYLVSMTSETEKEFVQNLSSSDLKSRQSAWIGLVHRLPKVYTHGSMEVLLIILYPSSGLETQQVSLMAMRSNVWNY